MRLSSLILIKIFLKLYFDAIGRIVATYYNAQQINISNLPEGFYNINIKLEDKNVIKPLIIQRF